MELISNYSLAIEALKNREILVTCSDNQYQYYSISNDKICIRNNNARYLLSLKDFELLFAKDNFYLYEKQKEEDISLQKDEEYYNWKHK